MSAIKAITIMQPWASALAAGYKEFETRSWRTDYVGKVAIHAGLGTPKDFTKRPAFEEVESLLLRQNYMELPKGRIIGFAFLTECIPMTQDFINRQTEQELALGHWEEGRYAWKLSLPQLLPRYMHVKIKGQQGLWNYHQGE